MMWNVRRRGCLSVLAAGWALAIALGAIAQAGETTPQRVVAAGGVITEIAYALGQGNRLVGVDSTSQFPPEALRSTPDIGYVRALSAEGILSLKPEIVLAIEGAGPPDVLRLLGEAHVPVRVFGDDVSEQGVLTRILRVGEALGVEDRAQALADQTRKAFSILAEKRAAIRRPARVLFVLSLQNGRVIVGGRNSSADAIIRLAGAENAATMVEGFKPLSDEGLIAAAPDVILMMERGGHAVSPVQVFAHAAFQAVPAAERRALITMDGLLLLGFGPRTPQAAMDLMSRIDAIRGDKL